MATLPLTVFSEGEPVCVTVCVDCVLSPVGCDDFVFFHVMFYYPPTRLFISKPW